MIFNCKPKITTSTDTSSTTTYTVTFDVNGGSAVASQTIEKNKTATRPKNPTKADNLFVNWYSDKELKNVFDFATAITKNTTLYAKWRSDKATIRFLDKGAEYIPTKQILIGAKVTRPAMKTKDGYNFLGYFSDRQLTKPFDFDATIDDNEVIVYVRYDELMFKYEIDGVTGFATVTGLEDDYKITGKKGKTNIILTIPATINGVKITDITKNNMDVNDNRFRFYAQDDGFRRHPLHKIVKVALPEGIIRINAAAFMESRITNINIPSTITTIRDGALNFDGVKMIDIKCDPTTPPTIDRWHF